MQESATVDEMLCGQERSRDENKGLRRETEKQPTLPPGYSPCLLHGNNGANQESHYDITPRAVLPTESPRVTQNLRGLDYYREKKCLAQSGKNVFRCWLFWVENINNCNI